MGCLDNIIKLSRTECECFDTDKPVDYDEGQADVYLDELEGLSLNLLDSVTDCENGNIWDKMDRARANASQRLKADLLACIGLTYMSRRPNYTGLIGDVKFSQTLNFSQTKAGIVIKVPKIEGGFLKIRRLGVIFNAVASVTINIYSNVDMDNAIGTYTFNSAANTVQYASLNTPLELPLWSTEVDKLEYYLVYDKVGFLPKNNKTDCGCGGKSPLLWKNWLSVQGIRGDNTEYDNYTTSSELNGLVVDGDLYCQTGRLICSDERPLDFENDGIAMQLAFAVRFKAGELLLEEILASAEINRYTMLDRETLWGKRNHYRKKYDEWVQFLCENIEPGYNDCLKCRPNSNISKGTIQA